MCNSTISLHECLRELASRPGERLVRHWNWKSAFLSSCFRATIFFFVNLQSGLPAAGAAMAAEFLFRLCTAGFYGAMTQSLSRVEPLWHGAFAAFFLLPAFQHSLELLVHWLRGTPHLIASIGSSIVFTILSTTVNLYLMRNGAMVVGAGSRTLWQDLAAIPGLLARPRLQRPQCVPIVPRAGDHAA